MWIFLSDFEWSFIPPQYKHYASCMLLKKKRQFSKTIVFKQLLSLFQDLKPGNILVAAEGILKITDFGQSCYYLEDDMSRTYENQVKYVTLQTFTGMTLISKHNGFQTFTIFRCLLDGIGLQNCFLVLSIILQKQICGRVVVFQLSYISGALCFVLVHFFT